MSLDLKAGNENEQKKRDSFEEPPLFYAAVVLVLSFVPFFLNLFGVDFASLHKGTPLDVAQNSVSSLPNSMLFYNLTGPLTHTILEWSALCTAIFTAILGFIHYRVTKNVAVPIIAMALLCAGAVDVSHIFAADNLVESVAGKEFIAPFSWTSCRLFNVSLMVIGVGGLLAYPQKKLNQKGLGFIVLVSFLFGVIAYATIQLCANSLPYAQLSQGMMSNLYEVLPLALFLVAGAFVYYPFYKRHPSFFSYGLLLSVIPEIITEIHMVFGSLKLFDNHFNGAHFLKILGYFIPFMGLCFDYLLRDRKSKGIYQELAVANQKLDFALSQVQIVTKSKSNFLASMTHELRTPMNGIIGMSHLLGGAKLEPAQIQQVDIIKGCANSLLAMINDILDFSKLEAGKRELESLPFNVKKLCKESLELVRFQAESKDLRLEFECHKSVPDYVTGDPNCLRQILSNFLSNAIKFTAKGHVRLVLSCPENPSMNEMETACIRFSVKDTGVGVPENIADYLFEPFTQADSNISRKFGGTGLGLAISRKLARLMGGKIWLKNLEGRGSCFCFEVPLALASQGAAEELEQREKGAEKALDRQGLQILVAEDNRVNQLVILSVLKKIGYQADVVNNGLEALEALDKKHYDLIFMDVMMPVMNGLEATKEICRRFKNKSCAQEKKPHIVAVTACTTPEDRARCFKAGMDDFMGKPVTLSDLKDKIRAMPQVSLETDLESGIKDKNEIKNEVSDMTTPYEMSPKNAPVIKTVVTFKGTRFEPKKVLKSFEGDEEMIPDMIDLFLKTSLEYMGQIKGAIESKNSAGLQLHSHTLKGSVKIFYANRAAEISQALEDLGQNKNFENAQSLYNDLEKELPLLQQELKEFKKKLA